MAQKASRESTVVVADQTFRVTFSILAIVALRDRWGFESDDEVLARLDKLATGFGKGKADFKMIADLMWAGLRRHHAEVTPEQCLELLDEAGLESLPSVMSAILGTLSAAAPPQGARQARPPKRINGRSVSTS